MGNQSARTSLNKEPKNPNALHTLLMEHGKDADILAQLQSLLNTETTYIPEIKFSDGTEKRKHWPLYLAAVHVDLAHTVPVCEELIRRGEDVNGTVGGWTPLHVAVEREDTHLMACLLGHGARATYQDGDRGFPALEYAANKLKRVSLECLIDHGVDINAKSNVGDSIAFTLTRNTEDEASIQKSIEMLRWAHSRGLDINTHKNDGYTPLHRTAVNGLVDYTRVLIELGADVNATNQEGRTPAQEAVHKYTTHREIRDVSGVPECIRLLVEAGAADPGPLPNPPVDDDASRLDRIHQQLQQLRDLRGNDDERPRRVTKADNTRKIQELESRLEAQKTEYEERQAQAEARIAKLEQLVNDMINLQPGAPGAEEAAEDFRLRSGW